MWTRLTAAIVMLVVATAAVADAQPAAKPARVGFLTAASRSSFGSGERLINREAFSGRLRELGWIEGQNLVIESRYADGAYERLPALAGELARLPMDVIFANSAPAALAAKRATTSIPIVFETLGDPVVVGADHQPQDGEDSRPDDRAVAAGASRPGDRVTGRTAGTGPAVRPSAVSLGGSAGRPPVERPLKARPDRAPGAPPAPGPARGGAR